MMNYYKILNYLYKIKVLVVLNILEKANMRKKGTKPKNIIK